ncbi:MAG TPA: lytic murein transglycosylase [Solirubrobacteraceae bacterium]|nr:lytic murein transglycosylase [Solirubrobacteraceae bacterium]
MSRTQPRITPLACALAIGALALTVPAPSLAASSPQVEPTPAGASETTSAATTTTTVAPAGEVAPSTSAQEAAPTGAAPGEAEAVAGAGAGAGEAAPEVEAQRTQGASASGTRARRQRGARRTGGARTQPGGGASSGGARAKHKAPAPGTLTPALPFSLQSPLSGVPDFFIESFQVPPFLLPIFQAAGTAYGIPWQVLAAINEVETDYGRDLSVSSAGAEGWMQFLPEEWAQYGVDANGDGWEDPYNPADAIFAAARYLRAAGGASDIKAAVYSYNHSQSYVESVMLRAQLLGATPSELLGAITGLTEARFPVHAPSHFSDGFPTAPASAGEPAKALVGTTIYTQAGAPVIAVQDGEVVQVGDSPSLGRFVALRDAYGNTYVYAQLGEVSSVYPVLEPRLHSAVSARIAGAEQSRPRREAAPSGPATAGAQPRSPLSEQATISELALGAAAGLEASAATRPRSSRQRAKRRHHRRADARVHAFAEGADEVYLQPLVAGVQVIAGTVLGHAGESGEASGGAPSQQGEGPHILFQIRPAGVDAPLVDPKPILDGWVALEDSSIFRAKGENPFLATSPTVGQVLLESKQQLEPQVLHDPGIRLGRCARQDVQEGRVDKRVLAMLEYLSVSALRPTVSGLPCTRAASAATAANAPVGAASEAVAITAVNGVPIAGHQGPGSLADQTVRKLLMLQGLSRPKRIVSLMSYPGAAGVLAGPRGADAIRVAFAKPGGGARAAADAASGLSRGEWIELVDRLGEIPDPTVPGGHSSASVADGASSTQGEAAGEGAARGHD